MPANECIPYKSLADTITAKCSAAVVGKRFVVVSGDRTGGGGGGAEGSTTTGVGLSTDPDNVYKIKQAGAKVAALGVAAYDAAENALVKVFARGVGNILPITAGGAFAAGEEVESDAEGRAVKLAEGKALGMAMTKSPGAGKDAEILFY